KNGADAAIDGAATTIGETPAFINTSTNVRNITGITMKPTGSINLRMKTATVIAPISRNVLELIFSAKGAKYVPNQSVIFTAWITLAILNTPSINSKTV